MPAAPKPLAVHAWPQHMHMAVDALRSGLGLTAICVVTPAPHNRLVARALIRDALRETLGNFFEQPAASIALVSRPGQPIALEGSRTQLHLSVSHLPGMSVAAISRSGAIGVDVMHIGQPAAEMADWSRVALDYLGPAATALLRTLSPARRPAAFAQAWTRLEASLKCLGMGLTEWTPLLARQLATCRVTALSLPEPCCGTVALGTGTCPGDSTA